MARPVIAVVVKNVIRRLHISMMSNHIVVNSKGLQDKHLARSEFCGRAKREQVAGPGRHADQMPEAALRGPVC
jgi:hypothetical protein